MTLEARHGGRRLAHDARGVPVPLPTAAFIRPPRARFQARQPCPELPLERLDAVRGRFRRRRRRCGVGRGPYRGISVYAREVDEISLEGPRARECGDGEGQRHRGLDHQDEDHRTDDEVDRRKPGGDSGDPHLGPRPTRNCRAVSTRRAALAPPRFMGPASTSTPSTSCPHVVAFRTANPPATLDMEIQVRTGAPAPGPPVDPEGGDPSVRRGASEPAGVSSPVVGDNMSAAVSSVFFGLGILILPSPRSALRPEGCFQPPIGRFRIRARASLTRFAGVGSRRYASRAERY